MSASHSRTVLSALPETIRVPSGLNATLYTASVWPVSGWPTGWPVSASHSRTVLSAAAGDDARAVGAERHAVHTMSVWPVSGWPTGWPVSASHSRTVLSALPEAMRVPVGAERHAGHRVGVAGQRLADGLAGVGVPQPHRVVGTAGGDAVPVGAERHAVHRVRVAGQRLADRVGRWPRPTAARVLSSLPEAMRVPSGLNATLYTASGVAGQRLADGLAGVGVPQPHRLVVSCRRRCACRRG